MKVVRFSEQVSVFPAALAIGRVKHACVLL